jgi:hypothetical protein
MSDAASANRFRAVLVGLVVFLALAFIAALVLRSQRTVKAVAVVPTAPEPKPAVEAAPMPDNALERARRAEAVASIESGNYKAAIEALSQILKKGKGVGDEIELLRIAKELDSRASERAASAGAVQPSSPNPSPNPSPTQAKPSRTKVPATKSARVAKASAERPVEGQLLVFSVPDGLEVEIDGIASGTTPLRLPAAPGTHQVTVFKKNVRLQDRTVVLGAGNTSTVDFDVREKLLAVSKPAEPVAESEAAPTASEPLTETPMAKPQEPVAPPAPTAPPAVVKAILEPPKPQVDPPAVFGEVFVAASSLGGEVFINGRSYGAGPLLARDIRVGEAVVELRANGETKRRKEVAVKKDQRAEVRFR